MAEPSNQDNNIKGVVIALLVAIVAGVIVAIIVGEGRFAPRQIQETVSTPMSSPRSQVATQPNHTKATATSVATKKPTSTAKPTSRPTSRPVPITCQIQVDSGFQAVWLRAGGPSAGCPIGNAYTKRVAIQSYQNGFMLWRGGQYGDANGLIYVVYNNGRWQEYQDNWRDGMAERAGYSAPNGLYEPKRGFGKLWQDLGGPNASIGWALSDERGSDFGRLQDFPNSAVIFEFPGEQAVFLPDGSRWVR